MPESYPWLQRSWQQLHRTGDRLPHSLLISGVTGLGKNELASQLAAGLLCQQPNTDGSACGQCKSCHLLAAGSHPDFRLIQPEEDSSNILVDQIRALIEYLSLRPHTSPRKLVILTPAEAMNINAANSLLKVLEEPPADTVLVLVSNSPQRLPATVRSRCSSVLINPPETPVAMQWLAEQGIDAKLAVDLLAAANGAPLQARNLHEQGYQQARTMLLADLQALQAKTGDPVECAVRWKEIGAGFCLGWLCGLIADLIQIIHVGQEGLRLNNPSLGGAIGNMAKDMSPQRLFGLLEKTIESSNLAQTPLDDSLLIEDILIGWSKTSI